MFHMIADMFISNAIALGIAGVAILLMTGVAYLFERPVYKKFRDNNPS